MGELLDRLITALWQTIVFCGPMWFVFVAIMIAVCSYCVFLTFRDEATEARDSLRRTARSGLDSPDRPGIFDQDQLSAWMPAVPDAQSDRRRLLRYDRRQRDARRSVA